MQTIEQLEPRIAPASVTLTYTDHDGDLVKLKLTTPGPTAPPFDNTDLTFLGGGDAGQLATVNLTDPAFTGANVAFSVVRKPGGDGLAHVGRINATGVNLGTVLIKGDLGVLDAGDGTGTALKALTARSMGLLGTATQGSGDLQSDLVGAVGSVTVLTDLKHAHLNVTGGADATVGKLTIGGSLIGGNVVRSGTVSVTGNVGVILVRGDLIGGAANYAGGIDVLGSIGSLTVRGSLYGNAADFGASGGPAIFHEGQVFAGLDIGAVKVGRDLIGGAGPYGGEIRSGGNMGPVTIGGSLLGGPGFASAHVCSEKNMGPVKIGGSIIGDSIFSGWVESFGTIASVTVGGSVIGGTSSVSGTISAQGAIGLVKLRGDLIGGSISGTQPDSFNTGQISGQRIAGVIIGGSILAGTDTSTSGGIFVNGTVTSFNDIGFVTVKGSLVGNVTGTTVSPVIISARGQIDGGDGETDLAIGKITIGGRVEHAQILAGFIQTTPSNGNAQIGSVMVGGDWRASSLVAGIQDANATGYGDAGDTVIPQPPADAILSRIGSITIRGLVLGTANTGDQFGFTAQVIGTMKVNGVKLPLSAEPTPDPAIQLAPLTGDVTLREV